MAITLQTIESLPLVEEVNENTSLVGWDGEKTVRIPNVVTYNTEDQKAGSVPVNEKGVLQPHGGEDGGSGLSFFTTYDDDYLRHINPHTLAVEGKVTNAEFKMALNGPVYIATSLSDDVATGYFTTLTDFNIGDEFSYVILKTDSDDVYYAYTVEFVHSGGK